MSRTLSSGKIPSILVIEDNPQSLNYFEKLLESEGYEVRLIPESALALDSVRKRQPDLILLDIMMPEMDGYEICRQLKADLRTCDIPVIFISALSESVDKVSAFGAGGVDYIVKPFHKDEALARIRTHLRIRELQQQLQQSNQLLERRVAEKSAELADQYEKTMQIQSQIQQAQKLEAIGTLAGGIAHDFNNILFSMYGYLELILDNAEKGSKIATWTRHVFDGAERAGKLVDHILAFSRQKKTDPVPVHIRHIVKEVLNLSRATLPSTIELRQEIRRNCGLVLADPTEIHQVAMNLITNAYHSMTETGGLLTVKLEEVQLTAESASTAAKRDGTYLCLSISDTGIGMDETVKARIFDPYFTTRKEGTGLGLSVVHGIVTRYNGWIEAESEPGKGSCFRVYLPRLVHRADLRKPEKESAVPRGNETILLVDDEPQVVDMLVRSLESLGYEVVSGTSSLDALDTFQKEPDRFDLVITDLTMPKMTGIRLTQEILRVRPGFPVILCTGFSEELHQDALHQLGIREVIRKPAIRDQLAAVIRKVLDSTAPISRIPISFDSCPDS